MPVIPFGVRAFFLAHTALQQGVQITPKHAADLQNFFKLGKAVIRLPLGHRLSGHFQFFCELLLCHTALGAQEPEIFSKAHVLASFCFVPLSYRFSRATSRKSTLRLRFLM